MLAHLLRHLAARLGRGDRPDFTHLPQLVESGRADEAERMLRRHLARVPRDAEALHLLALVCHAAGRADEAIALLGQALDIQPQALFHANLAAILRASGGLADAEAHARQAVALAPDEPAFMLGLASILNQSARRLEALQWTERVLENEPGRVDALLIAGALESELFRPERALGWYRKALEVDPKHPGALIAAWRARRWLCDWSESPAVIVQLMERWASHPDDPAYGGLNPFVAYEVACSSSIREAVTQAYAERVLSVASGREPLFRFSRGRKARLRIGYLSADYHNHPTMHLMRGLFRLHDRRRFQVFAYSLGPDDGTAFRQEVVAQVDGFRDLQPCSAPEAASRIHEDGIDILVDLKGFTHGARPEILALRPAPVRVAWLGYPASTGRGLNDYVIADRVTVPPEAACRYGEKPVWLPHSYQINDSEQPIAAMTPRRAQLDLPEGVFVFACFNHVYKIEPLIFAVWMRVLRRVPQSVLWLYQSNDGARANLLREAGARGIDAARLRFGGTLCKPEHLARLKNADLFLDTLYINAHTGASDALWAGLPVLTCPQEGFPSRVAASLLAAVELPRLICRDLAQYEEEAVRLAHHPQELAAMRRHLETTHGRLPLYDTARFTRNLERAYDTMWERYLAGESPAPFEVREA
jgi:protein O-GlcNAc transferase